MHIQKLSIPLQCTNELIHYKDMIEIKKLAFNYGQLSVLKNISMTLEPGRIYGLLGENGVGKTTLLTLLCGLKKPQAGSLTIDGKNPFDRLPSTLRDICYLPDEVLPLRMTAESYAKTYGCFYPDFSFDRFVEIMSLFEVELTQMMYSMSAGQLKKTCISFALACSTPYLFMDEPTNGLDIPGKAQFRSAIMKYTREDATIVISTHQVRDLENIIDPIVILDRQDVLLNASLEEITKKLFFDYSTTLCQDAYYSEQLPGNFIQVCPNVRGEESKVNIEALFNAVHKNKSTLKALFCNE